MPNFLEVKDFYLLDKLGRPVVLTTDSHNVLSLLDIVNIFMANRDCFTTLKVLVSILLYSFPKRCQYIPNYIYSYIVNYIVI